MEQIFLNLKDVALATTVIALITIFLVGCLKLIPAIKNLQGVARKALYQTFSIVISSGLSVLYCLIFREGKWGIDMLHFAVVVAMEVNILYPMYENYGLRTLFQKICSLVISPRKASTIEEPKTEQAETTQSTDVAPDSEWLQ